MRLTGVRNPWPVNALTAMTQMAIKVPPVSPTKIPNRAVRRVMISLLDARLETPPKLVDV